MGLYYLKSMTAFGGAATSFPEGSFKVEIQSVNRRHLEINFYLPRQFSRLEIDLRKKISAQVARGALTVSVTFKPDNKKKWAIKPNLPLAEALQEAWVQLAQLLKLDTTLPTELLTQERELFQREDDELHGEANSALHLALDDALDAFLRMKEKEGELLAEDFKNRLSILAQQLEVIEARSGHSSEKYRQKLMQKLEDLLPGQVENEERIIREIALFAERVDVTEEIVRLKGHFKQFEELLHKPPAHALDARGKTLEFFVQEMHREINTIGSKASDLEMSHGVVNFKSELEKIREQVQNIE